MTSLLKKVADFVAKKWAKSPKISIITLTPLLSLPVLKIYLRHTLFAGDCFPRKATKNLSSGIYCK
jgi:hypothetical protein